MNIMSSSNGRPFGPRGCQVPVGRGVCGETKTLDIINEFKRLYEEKMKEIDTFGGGDNLELKMRLQQEWIKDLSEQNELLVKAVEELECEATERVLVLEDKLQQSAKCICEEQENNKTKERLIQDLQQKLNKFHSYGDIDALKTELTCKKEECESLKQNCHCLKVETATLNTKITELEKLNDCLKCGTADDKQQLQDLENRFKDFLKEKSQLKQKCKNRFEECRQLEEENLKLKSERECLKAKVGVFLKDNEEYAMCKVVMEGEIKELREKLNKCLECKKSIEQVEQENKKLTKQIIVLNDENRNLLQTIEKQKCKLQCSSTLTQEEIVKLNSTIDDLQKNLERTKRVQEEEDRAKSKEISKLENMVANLECCLKEAQDKAKVCSSCKGKFKVGFMENEEVQATLGQDQTLEERMEGLAKRDQIIKVQNETLSLLQSEIDAMQVTDEENAKVRAKQEEEIQKLRSRIADLENELKNCEKKSANLQVAVDLYQNSINVLEASEEKYKLEMNQQKSTICNLQKALVSAKQELDCLRQKSEENVSFGWATRWFGSSEPKTAGSTNMERPVHDI